MTESNVDNCWSVYERVAEAMRRESSNTDMVFAPSPEHPVKAARWAQGRLEGCGVFVSYDHTSDRFRVITDAGLRWIFTQELIDCLYLLFEDVNYIGLDQVRLVEEESERWLPDRRKIGEVVEALKAVSSRAPSLMG